jgi:hypothetical protein
LDALGLESRCAVTEAADPLAGLVLDVVRQGALRGGGTEKRRSEDRGL